MMGSVVLMMVPSRTTLRYKRFVRQGTVVFHRFGKSVPDGALSLTSEKRATPETSPLDCCALPDARRPDCRRTGAGDVRRGSGSCGKELRARIVRGCLRAG